MSDDVRADARRLLQGITRGPWNANPSEHQWGACFVTYDPGDRTDEQEQRNAEFIEAAPELVDRLLTEIDRLDNAKWSWATYQQTCRTLQADPTETVPAAAQRVVTERDAAVATLARIEAVAADVDQDGGHSGPTLARHILNIIGGEK